MTSTPLRVIVADDERPARSFLVALLRALPDVTLVGEAENGTQAVSLIEEHKPDLALLDLQMPEVDGLGVVRLVRKPHLPLIIFVTAYDEFAVKAFEVNAVDYLLKPVDPGRLRHAIARAQDRLERADLRDAATGNVREAVELYERESPPQRLERIPVRQRHDIVLVPVSQIAWIVAEGELLHLTTVRRERHTITYRLKDLEARLDPNRFVRLGRGVLANLDQIAKVTPMPGGMYTVTLQDGQQLDVSRIQSRALRERLLRL
jgi:two-component system LytT family response regulator